MINVGLYLSLSLAMTVTLDYITPKLTQKSITLVTVNVDFWVGLIGIFNTFQSFRFESSRRVTKITMIDKKHSDNPS